jgi:hypothetical protein
MRCARWARSLVAWPALSWLHAGREYGEGMDIHVCPVAHDLLPESWRVDEESHAAYILEKTRRDVRPGSSVVQASRGSTSIALALAAARIALRRGDARVGESIGSYWPVRCGCRKAPFTRRITRVDRPRPLVMDSDGTGVVSAEP